MDHYVIEGSGVGKFPFTPSPQNIPAQQKLLTKNSEDTDDRRSWEIKASRKGSHVGKIEQVLY